MKRLLAVLIAGSMALFLSGCNDDKDAIKTDDAAPTEQMKEVQPAPKVMLEDVKPVPKAMLEPVKPEAAQPD